MKKTCETRALLCPGNFDKAASGEKLGWISRVFLPWMVSENMFIVENPTKKNGSEGVPKILGDRSRCVSMLFFK